MAQQKKAQKGLHKFIATGGKPKDYKRNPALNPKTVNNLKSK